MQIVHVDGFQDRCAFCTERKLVHYKKYLYINLNREYLKMKE